MVEHVLTKSNIEPTPLKPLDLFAINCHSVYDSISAHVCVCQSDSSGLCIVPGISLLSALEENGYDVRKNQWWRSEIYGWWWEVVGERKRKFLISSYRQCMVDRVHVKLTEHSSGKPDCIFDRMTRNVVS